jgi:hypothetical protein
MAAARAVAAFPGRRRRYGGDVAFSRRRLAVGLTALAVLGVLALTRMGTRASGLAAPPALAPTPTAAANEATARSEAQALLVRFTPPLGAVPTGSATPPVAGRHGFVQPASPNLVASRAWWTLNGSPRTVLAAIEAHPPPGARIASSGSGEDHGHTTSEWVELTWPPVSGVLLSRSLVVEALPLRPHGTALGVDAQVIWITPRPPSEVIPPGSRLLRVSVLDTIERNVTVQGPLRITNARRVERAAALLNALPAAQPGTRLCPADFGILVRLAFYTHARRPPQAVALIDPWGCGGVHLTLDGRPEPALESAPLPGSGSPSSATLVERMDHVLGVHIRTSPRRG